MKLPINVDKKKKTNNKNVVHSHKYISNSKFQHCLVHNNQGTIKQHTKTSAKETLEHVFLLI